MRLVCPNCSAQYEIDGSMIPDEGRDVQCSNCGHTWFELPGPAAEEASYSDADTLAADADEDEYGFEDPDPEDIPSSRAETRIEDISREMFEDDVDTSSLTDDDDGQDTIQEFASEPEDADDLADETPDDEPENDDGGYADAAAAVAASASGKTAGRRPADAADLDILREEAERELSQRRAPPSESIETQADLGLETIRQRNTPSRALRARMAHLGEDEPDDFEPEKEQDAPVQEPSSDEDDGYEEPRRDLLPDIDEINSTLKPAKGSPEAALAARQRSGFRAGFLLVLFLAVGLIFAYAQAPAIARALPDTEPALISYVDQANALRDWISGLIGN